MKNSNNFSPAPIIKPPIIAPGIEVKPIITIDGDHEVNSVFFTDVKVPVENRIGEEGKGWTYAKGLLEHERTGLAGLSKSLVELEQLKDKARTVQRGNGNLTDDASYKSKVGELEIDLFDKNKQIKSSKYLGKKNYFVGEDKTVMYKQGKEINQWNTKKRPFPGKLLEDYKYVGQIIDNYTYFGWDLDSYSEYDGKINLYFD